MMMTRILGNGRVITVEKNGEGTKTRIDLESVFSSHRSMDI